MTKEEIEKHKAEIFEIGFYIKKFNAPTMEDFYDMLLFAVENTKDDAKITVYSSKRGRIHMKESLMNSRFQYLSKLTKVVSDSNMYAESKITGMQKYEYLVMGENKPLVFFEQNG